MLYSAYKKATFISCWAITQIKRGEEDSSDSLNHWRFYGDDGKGACLMIPLDNLLTIFLDKLFQVTYDTETRGGGSSGPQRPVRKLKDGLVKRLNAMRSTIQNAMDDLDEVIAATHPLLFLFKSSEYKAEKEVRSVIHADNYSLASGVNFDNRTPQRAYIDGIPSIIASNSILYYGPKADHHKAIETMGLAANLGIDLKVFVSSMPYR